MLRLTTLGAIDLRDRHGHPIREVLAQPKRVALLVYLAVESRRGPVSRDRLLAFFWPESDAAHGRNTLSQSLHHLRQSLGTDVLESHGANAVQLRGERLWCDAVAFADALEDSQAELALDLYRGEFCPTLFVSGTPEIERWLDEQRRWLRERTLGAARTLAERLASRGDNDAAVRAARRALALRPEDEADVRALLSVMDRSGDATSALHAYQEYARRLKADLDAEPEAATRQLVETVRQRREAAAAPAQPPATDRRHEHTEPAASTPVRTRPGLVRAASLAAVAVLVALAGAMTWRRYSHVAAPVSPRTIAVFPFAVRARPDLGYLGEGMMDLISATLEGAGGLRAIDPRSVAAALWADSAGGPADYASLSRRLGAGRYITGDVVGIAGRVQVSAGLYEVARGDRAVATATLAGDSASVFELVDGLVGRLIAGIAGGRDTTLTRLAALTTRSLPALKAYLDGEQALRVGHDARAAAAFREASQLDSTFALAQYRLALTSTWVTVPGFPSPVGTAQIADRHSARLAPLARDLVSAYRAYKEVRIADAERTYLRISQSHPDNVEAWMMLAETYFHYNPFRGRSPLEAVPAFRRVLALDPSNPHATIHLARLAALDGRVQELDSLARLYLAHHQDAERVLEMQALQAAVHDDSASLAAVSAAAGQADELVATSALWATLVYAENQGAARWLAPRYVSAPNDTSVFALQGRRAMTEIGVDGGRFEAGSGAGLMGAAGERGWLLEVEALVAAEPSLPVPSTVIAALRDTIAAWRSYRALAPITTHPDPDLGAERRLYLLGLLETRLGDTVSARARARGLENVKDPRHAAAARAMAAALRAELARRAGDLRQALGELEHFAFGDEVLLIAHWGVRERFARAEVLHAMRRDAEALPWYESFSTYADLGFAAAAHLRRAEIEERMGDRERAAFHYGRFLQLWRGCDPAFQPMVAKARAALARLAT